MWRETWFRARVRACSVNLFTQQFAATILNHFDRHDDELGSDVRSEQTPETKKVDIEWSACLYFWLSKCGQKWLEKLILNKLQVRWKFQTPTYFDCVSIRQRSPFVCWPIDSSWNINTESICDTSKSNWSKANRYWLISWIAVRRAFWLHRPKRRLPWIRPIRSRRIYWRCNHNIYTICLASATFCCSSIRSRTVPAFDSFRKCWPKLLPSRVRIFLTRSDAIRTFFSCILSKKAKREKDRNPNDHHEMKSSEINTLITFSTILSKFP